MVIALVNWVQVARIVFTETRGLVERDFILAERSLGAGHARILFLHILPHLVPTAIVWGTLGIATTVLLEATLSFLGIGVQPPDPSWAISFSKARATSRQPPGWSSSPAPSSSSPRSPSTLSGMHCATFSIRPRGERLMLTLLAKRLVQCVLILFGVAAITFVLLYALPADPARMLAGRSATAQTVEKHPSRARPRPAAPRAVRPLCRRSGAGRSRPLLCAEDRSGDAHRRASAATLTLMAAGIVIEVLLGVLLGSIAALKRGGLVDRIVMMSAFVGVSAPQFVVALLLLYVFAATLGWFPMSGYGSAPMWCCRPPRSAFSAPAGMRAWSARR